MIEDTVTIHDKFSIEFKIGFLSRPGVEENDFSVNMWLFVPNSLDINRYTYQKSDFYKDFKSNIRLITPIYLLSEITDTSNLPFKLLSSCFLDLIKEASPEHISAYETQIKMFQSILKSALREEIIHIKNSKDFSNRQFLIDSFLKNLRLITTEYRNLQLLLDVPDIEKTSLNIIYSEMNL